MAPGLARGSFVSVRLAFAAVVVLAMTLCCAACRHGNENTSGARILGQRGRQPGQFTQPRAVVVVPGGDFVVIDRSGRIQRIDPKTGEVRKKWLLPEFSNGTPTGGAFDPHDNTLWIADTHYQRILHYDLEGNFLGKFGDPGTEPGQMIFPSDLCVDPEDGTLWICEFGKRSRIMHFTTEGKFLNEWGSEAWHYEDLSRPMAVDFDKQGRLFVCDAGNHRILVFDRKGTLLDSWGEAGEEPGKLKYPYDLDIAPDGTVYICEYGNSRLSRFTAEGKFLGVWGGPGYEVGQLFTPWGVTVAPDGAVIAADTNNGRLQVIDAPEQFFIGGAP